MLVLVYFSRIHRYFTSGSRSPKTLQTSRRVAPANRVSEVWLYSFRGESAGLGKNCQRCYW